MKTENWSFSNLIVLHVDYVFKHFVLLIIGPSPTSIGKNIKIICPKFSFLNSYDLIQKKALLFNTLDDRMSRLKWNFHSISIIRFWRSIMQEMLIGALLVQEPFNAEPHRSALISSYVTPTDFFYKRNHGPIPIVDNIDRSTIFLFSSTHLF